MHSPSRRALLRAAVLVPPASVLPAAVFRSAKAQTRAAERPVLRYFTEAEYAFVDAAVARLIPADDLGPGAREARVPEFIDGQLAGSYGSAETWYMQGPWRSGVPEQGYQLKLTPAALYRAAIRDIDEHVRSAGKAQSFAQLPAEEQDAFLHTLEDGKVSLPNADAKTFFSMLWDNTKEGFLADPMYGGNRDFVGWKLIGFPGPRYNYVAEIEQHGKRYTMPIVGIEGRSGRPVREA